MAHKIFQKTTSGWKQVKKVRTKENVGGNISWKLHKKAWVKTDNGWKLFYSRGLPKGIILPYLSNGTIPADWQLYTSAGQRLILGAYSGASVKSYGGSNGITHIGRMVTAGSHGPGLAPGEYTAVRTGDIDHHPAIQFDGDTHQGYTNGGHSHYNKTIALDVEPPNTHFKLIKSSADGNFISQNIGVFSTQNLSGVGLSKNTSYSGKLFSSGTTTGTTTGDNYDSGTWTTNTIGSHQHSVVKYSLAYALDTIKTYPINAGGHNHIGKIEAKLHDAARGDAYKNRQLMMWYSAAQAIYDAPGIIGMWEGATAPEGWTLCDGSNGSPDMRNHFLKLAYNGQEGTSDGEHKIPIATSTGQDVEHHHVAETRRGAGTAPYYIKHSTPVSHHHPENFAVIDHKPEYYALSFIMKLPD